MSSRDRLLAALRQGSGRGHRRRRVPLERLWAAFGAACPEAASGVDARSTLRDLLDLLAEHGALEQPRNAWDQTAQPPLPRQVTLLPWAQAPSAAAADKTTVAWAPELTFARDLTRPEQIDVLLVVQDFLAQGGRRRPPVPERERSAELFDDEKRLERLRTTGLFAPGRLSLDLLRCFAVSPPLVFEAAPGPAGRPALVLENHHSYHTFCRWNRERRTHAATVYGAGKGVLGALGSLVQLARDTGAHRLRYFGDLDATGLRIGRDLSALAAREGLSVEPAGGWYRLLLERGHGRSFVDPHARPPRPEDLAWLPEGLRAPTQRLLGQGRRLPQELVGWEAVRHLEREPVGEG